MVKRIACLGIFFCLLVAIPLALMGYKKVELGGPFLALMRSTSIDLINYKIEIPNIPSIPIFEPQQPAWYESVLLFLIKIANGLMLLINVIINLLNTVIQLLEFIFLLVRNLIKFKDTIRPVVASYVAFMV